MKELVEEKEGIPPVQQRLIYKGKQMYMLRPKTRVSYELPMLIPSRNDDSTAAKLEIQPGDVLHLVLALRGGQ